MKKIQIIGPYRGKSDAEKEQNIFRAWEESLHWWALGFFVLTPQCNSRNMSGVCSEAQFLRGYLDTIPLMNAVVVLPGYGTSEGSIKEVQYARTLQVFCLYKDIDKSYNIYNPIEERLEVIALEAAVEHIRSSGRYA